MRFERSSISEDLPVSTDELIGWLRLPEDALTGPDLGSLLFAAVAEIEEHADLAIRDQTVTAWLTPARTLRLPVHPATEDAPTVHLVEQDGTETLIDPTAYRYESGTRPRVVFLLDGLPWRNLRDPAEVRVVYGAGCGATDDIKLAVLSLAANWYETAGADCSDRPHRGFGYAVARAVGRRKRVTL